MATDVAGADRSVAFHARLVSRGFTDDQVGLQGQANHSRRMVTGEARNVAHSSPLGIVETGNVVARDRARPRRLSRTPMATKLQKPKPITANGASII